MRIEARVGECKSSERFLEFFLCSNPGISAFASEPRQVFHILFERCSEQWTPGSYCQDVSKQCWLLQQILVGACILIRQPFEEELGSMLIGKIAKKKLHFGIYGLHVEHSIQNVR